MKNKISIPIWKKTNLTVDEAAAYCGIGVKKLRKMTESEDCSLERNKAFNKKAAAR